MAYIQEEQVDIVHKALTLETAILVERNDVQLLTGQQFERFPSYEEVFRDVPPKRPVQKATSIPGPFEPDISRPPEAEMPSLWKQPLARIGLLLFAIGIIAFGGCLGAGPSQAFLAVLGITLGVPALIVAGVFCLILAVRSRNELHERMNEKLARTPAYLQSVEQAKRLAAAKQAQANEQARQEQERLDRQYALEMEQYETVLLPDFEKSVRDNRQEYADMRVEYEQDKTEWENKRSDAVAKLEEDVLANSEKLTELYDTTRLISIHYREIPILQWLFDDMRTSDHDIRYATELLDRDRQRIVTLEAADRMTHAIDQLDDELHQVGIGIMQLQGVQIAGLQYLEEEMLDILRVTEQIQLSGEDMRDASRRILFHQRVNTVDTALRAWRRHKEEKALKD